ncbi:hypothetical protein [Mucilaginibacter sp.]|uniref:hypothetical protein n=1 Tax=Mucilaginibacter sp. TaxID=1882438 RepID=UPI0032667711
MARDNFTETTIRVLAQRVGYLCSNPACRLHTVGPNSNPEKATIVGVAAHITAASKGGPRYDSTLTDVKRKQIDNGIWLCVNCSTLIDKDPNNYSTKLLTDWKTSSEAEMYEKLISPYKQPIKINLPTPFLEADLIWAHGGRFRERLSDKNIGEIVNGRRVIIAGSNPIIEWILDWNWSLDIYNNSISPAFNIKIEPIENLNFTRVTKLNKINNLQPYSKFSLEAYYKRYFEGNHIEADELLSKRIPDDLNGMKFKISYLDEHRQQHATVVTIDGQEIVNFKE